MSTTASTRMFRRRYTLAKDTPRLKAGTVVHFDPGDFCRHHHTLPGVSVAVSARTPH